MTRVCACGHTRHAHQHYAHTGDTRCAICDDCRRWRPRRWWFPWRHAANLIAEEEAVGWKKRPVPGNAVPPAALPGAGSPPGPPWPPAPAPGSTPARESTYPAPPAPALPRRPPPGCPDCGAPPSYTIRAWACDGIRVYGPAGALDTRMLCLAAEIDDFLFEQAQAGDDPDGF